jgi:HEAT repeat protein
VAPPPPRTLGQVNPALRTEARRLLLAGLSSHDPVTRTHCIEGLRESIGYEAKMDLLKCLGDPEPMVRFAASMACGEMRIGEARPALYHLLNDQRQRPDPHVQIGAIFALHRMGDTRFSAGLEQALRSSDEEVRANAAFAFGRLGERSAIKVLREAMRDSSAEVRLQVAEALWRLGDREGLRSLVAASISGHPAHQMVGILALAGPRDTRVIEHVRAGRDSHYIEVALVTARALGMLSSDELYSIAIDSSKSAEPRHRFLAAMALGAIGRWEAQEALALLLKDPDEATRVAAATAILQLR